MRLMLLSNSTAPGRKYLEHVMDALSEVLADVRRLVFVPFALADHDGYTTQVSTALSPLGIEVVGAHTADVASGEAIFVGGGNTFRLLRALHVRGLLPVRRHERRVPEHPDHQRHADRPAAVVRGHGAGAVPDQPALRRPRTRRHTHG
jgi:peptidase E